MRRFRLALLLSVIACRSGTPAPPPPTVFAATARPPIINPAWNAGAWCIDGLNVSTCASDNNNGVSCTCGTSGQGPLLTTNELTQGRWGGVPPRMTSGATIQITYLSAQTTDNAYFDLRIEQGTVVQILGQLTQVASGTLSGVVSRNRSTPQLLNATLASGLALGELVVDTTRSSRAWLKGLVSGTTWALTQALATPSTNQNITPAEDNGWTNGDSYVVYQLPAVPLRYARASITNWNAGLNNALLIKNIAITAGAGFDQVTLDGNALNVAECLIQSTVSMQQTFAALDNALLNDDMANAVTVHAGPGSASIFVVGGQYRSNTFFSAGGGVTITGDTVFNGSNVQISPETGAFYGTVYIDSGKTVAYTGGGTAKGNNNASYGIAFWGPGTLNISGLVRLAYPAGASQAAATFLQSGGWQLNGQSTAWFVTPSASPTANRTLSTGNVDTDLGTTTGAYLNPGGASITNGNP